MNIPFKKEVNIGSFYYLNDSYHREDGPAIEYNDGGKYWYKCGKLHRKDGPAIYLPDGYKSWWLNGNYYGDNDDFTNESWVRFVATLMFY